MKTTLFHIAVVAAFAAAGCQADEDVPGKVEPLHIEKTEMYFNYQGGTDSTHIKEEGVWIDQFSLDTPQDSSFHNVFDYRQGDTISYDWLQFCLQRNLIKIRVEANTHPCQRKATIGLQLGNSHGTIKIIQECSKEKGQ